MGEVTAAFICWRMVSADDHPHFALVPQCFKGLGVDPVLVDLPRHIGVIRVTDEIAEGRVVARNEAHVVIGDHGLPTPVDEKLSVTNRFPPVGLVGDDEIATEELLSYSGNGGTAKIGTGNCTAAVGVAIGGEGARIDGAVTSIGVIRRADESIFGIGIGIGQTGEESAWVNLGGKPLGAQPHEG